MAWERLERWSVWSGRCDGEKTLSYVFDIPLDLVRSNRLCGPGQFYREHIGAFGRLRLGTRSGARWLASVPVLLWRCPGGEF